ncbi:MAG: purine-binding chemotaxis protein CheW [Candidatus Omnitrophica bacterium]|nr:purine-binding chemotaxis protein CheW [Candidatus Omnitrophota bacterium]
MKQLIIFESSGKRYAADVSFVQEIARMRKVVPIPDTAKYVEGVMSLRGAIIPAVSFAKKLGITETQLNKTDRIMIINLKDYTLGIIVNDVLDIITVEESNITAPEGMLREASYLEGVLKTPEGITLLVDFQNLFTGEEEQNINRVKDKVVLTKKEQ